MCRPSFLLKLISVFLILFAFPLHGKQKFKSSFVSFDLGENWICKSFVVDWICHHYFQKGAKPALILITAKVGASSDNLDMYFQNFNQNQTSFFKKIYTKKISIHRQPWIENFDKNTRINLFSRQVVTICCDEGKEKVHVFIGFYAYEDVYTKYANQFLISIKSLRLSENVRQVIDQIRRQTDQHRANMASYLESILFETDNEDDIATQRKRKNFSFLITLFVFALILLCSAGAFYFFYYRKTKTKTKKTKYRKKRRR